MRKKVTKRALEAVADGLKIAGPSVSLVSRKVGAAAKTVEAAAEAAAKRIPSPALPEPGDLEQIDVLLKEIEHSINEALESVSGNSTQVRVAIDYIERIFEDISAYNHNKSRDLCIKWITDLATGQSMLIRAMAAILQGAGVEDKDLKGKAKAEALAGSVEIHSAGTAADPQITLFITIPGYIAST